MQGGNFMLEETILESIYLDREQSKLAERSQYEKEVYYTVKKVGNEEKLRNLISKIYNKRLRTKINNLLELTLEDNLKIESATLDKYYKQGFKDAVNLLIECLEKE